MVHGQLSLSLQDQDSAYLHSNAPSESSAVANGWLFFAIALGSLFTFTFFAALSTSFYCCEKIGRKDSDENNQTSLSEGRSEQKLLFSQVPLTVYPTTHSILQQDHNEVVESLSPAYRELPSTHLCHPDNSYTTLSMDQIITQNDDSTYPNSTKSSRKCHTTSLSSELTVNNGDCPNQSNSISGQACNPLLSQSASDSTTNPLRSQSAPAPHDSSLSIRVASSHDQAACMTSSTSGILTGEDLTTETFEERMTLPEPALSKMSGQRVIKDNQHNSYKETGDESPKEVKLYRGDKRHRRQATPAGNLRQFRERRCRSSGCELPKTEPPHTQTRSISETGFRKLNHHNFERQKSATGLSGYNKMVSKPSTKPPEVYEGGILKYNRPDVTTKVNRGASSFGEDRSCSEDPSTRPLSKYYALTFHREASILSDENDSNPSFRGASELGCQNTKTGSETSESSKGDFGAQTIENRGASALGMMPVCSSDVFEADESPGKFREQTPGMRAIIRPGMIISDSNNTRSRSLRIHSPHKTTEVVVCEQRDYDTARSEARDYDRSMNVTHTIRLNNKPKSAYQSSGAMRGASELGNQDGLAPEDHDFLDTTLGESVSLSFAYESASEDETASRFTAEAN